tara:strand:+ start:1155 stop:2057 length:903 start_codon:yes stop_codon:yes gene_type:complete
MKYHVPVLLNESINGLSIKPEGTYVDLTFGGGGHSKLILEKLNDKGRLISFDIDSDAIRLNKLVRKNFEIIESNFKFFDLHIEERGIKKVDGIFADLGISSYQIDNLKRGFSYKGKTELDMRMNKRNNLCAKKIVNEYDKEKLENIFFEYGEISNNKKIVKKIIESRKDKRIKYNSDFVNLLNEIFNKEISFKLLSRIFQAIRIEVNDEINALREMLTKSKDYLNSKGRLVVISYHSLEDRLVKNFINKSNFSSDYKKNLFGVKKEFYKRINKKPIVPTSDEIKNNPRSRSAKLRIGERL